MKPNALQLIGSYLFLDPQGELLRTQGRIMEMNGISVTVLDLVHFQGHYNTVSYTHLDVYKGQRLVKSYSGDSSPSAAHIDRASGSATWYLSSKEI